VQSAGRQEGVYRILAIMLESKSPKTLCGVVRNAYRPGQEVSIHHLEDLPSLQFDMLTTIVIAIALPNVNGGLYSHHAAITLGIHCRRTGCTGFTKAGAVGFSGTSDGNALASQWPAKVIPLWSPRPPAMV